MRSNRLRVLDEVPQEEPIPTTAPARSEAPAPAKVRVDDVALMRLIGDVVTRRLLDSVFAFTALILGFVLWGRYPDPSTGQLVGLGLYGLLALLILALRR